MQNNILCDKFNANKYFLTVLLTDEIIITFRISRYYFSQILVEHNFKHFTEKKI